MSNLIEVKVPDIGDFSNVDVIEILVAVGDTVQEEDPLVSLESDKASMEIPSSVGGVVKEILIAVGGQVSEGDVLVKVEAAETSSAAPKPAAESVEEAVVAPQAAAPKGDADRHAEVVILGGGPGGYTAAFRAADLGKKVTLIERYPVLGGVCLNVGCIPSKALLHMAQIVHEAEEMAGHGIVFGKPELNIDKIREFKEGVTKSLNGGLAGLAKQRKVTVMQGEGRFNSAQTIEVTSDAGVEVISFDHAVIAAGSQVTKIPVFPNDDPRLMDSTDALNLEEIPEKLLIVGGGIIGLEMATVYHAFGSQISVVELMDQLIPGCDKDLVKPLHNRIKKQYENIWLKTKVASIEPLDEGLKVTFEGANAPEPTIFDRVLVAVGRRPNGKLIGAENAGLAVDEMGFIPVDRQQKTG